jgi:hypothetical protein
MVHYGIKMFQEKRRKIIERAVIKNTVLYNIQRKSSLKRARVNYYWIRTSGNHRQECQTKSKYGFIELYFGNIGTK